MKNTKQGFIGVLVLIIFTLVVVVSGSYLYMNSTKNSKNEILREVSNSTSTEVTANVNFSASTTFHQDRSSTQEQTIDNLSTSDNKSSVKQEQATMQTIDSNTISFKPYQGYGHDKQGRFLGSSYGGGCCGVGIGRLNILSVFGTDSIQQGQTATWTINSNATSLNLSSNRVKYEVSSWGDGSFIDTQSSNTFTHQYANAGVYSIIFTVYDEMLDDGEGGVSVESYVTVNKSSESSTSTIKIISPSGGQVYNTGDTLDIRWSGAMKLLSIISAGGNGSIKNSLVLKQLPLDSDGDTSGLYRYVIPDDILKKFNLISGFDRSGIFYVNIYSSYGENHDVFSTSKLFTVKQGCGSGMTLFEGICYENSKINLTKITPNPASFGFTQVAVSGFAFQQNDQVCFYDNKQILISCVTPDSITSNQMSFISPVRDPGLYTVQVKRGGISGNKSNTLGFMIVSR